MALEAQGSSPCIHPAETVKPWLGGFKYFELVFASRTGSGLSPSGKAQDFDSCISLVRIQLAQLEKPDKWDRRLVYQVFLVCFSVQNLCVVNLDSW